MLKPFVVGLILATGAGMSAAQAQLFSEPFQFNGRGVAGGVGMSPAYREAILDEHLTGNRPDNLLRGPGGALIDVTEGPNGLAVPRTRQSNIFTGSVNRGVRGLGFSFRGTSDSPSFAMLPDPAHAIDAWTAMASGIAPPRQRWILRGHQPAPIDAWTAQAAALPYAEAQN